MTLQDPPLTGIPINIFPALLCTFTFNDWKEVQFSEHCETINKGTNQNLNNSVTMTYVN